VVAWWCRNGSEHCDELVTTKRYEAREITIKICSECADQEKGNEAVPQSMTVIDTGSGVHEVVSNWKIDRIDGLSAGP